VPGWAWTPRWSSALFVRTALAQFYRETEREEPGLSFAIPGQDDVEGIFLAIVQNTAPWTYLGERPVNPCPDASFDTGIDVLGLRRLRTVSTLRHVRQLVQPGARPAGRDVVLLHDLPELTLRAARPTALQLDGESVGVRESVRLVAHPEALSVVV
jgi:diacylglycerol kinase family enzyme